MAEIARLGCNHYPNEHGGFLIGKYSSNFQTLVITKNISPIDFHGFPISFERSVKGIENLFHKLFNQYREIYIGEWHTHPDSTTQFSHTDLQAMKSISCSNDVKVVNPILLIISINNDSVNSFTFYLYEKNNLIPYEQH